MLLLLSLSVLLLLSIVSVVIYSVTVSVNGIIIFIKLSKINRYILFCIIITMM